MEKTQKKLFSEALLFFICIFALMLTPSALAKSADKSIRLGVMPSMDYLPLAVAEKEKIFDELGIKVDIKVFYSANERDAAFQSKAIDGTVIDYTGAMLQRAGGVDLKLSSRCDALFYLVANKKSGIEKTADLKGKKIAVSQNTVIDYFVDQSIKSGDLKPKDIAKFEVNRIPIRFELLMNNQIDATGLPNPLAKIAENGGAKILLSNKDLNLSITGIVFHAQSIAEKEIEIKKLYEAYSWGVEYIKNNPVEKYSEILIKKIGFTPETLAPENIPQYEKLSMPDEKSLLSVKEWLVEKKLIEADFDLNALLDDRFVAVRND